MTLAYDKSGCRMPPIESVDVGTIFAFVIYFYMVFEISLISCSHVMLVIWWISFKGSAASQATESLWNYLLNHCSQPSMN
jgi:hypothetical protein